MDPSRVAVLPFGGRRVPRGLRGLAVVDPDTDFDRALTFARVVVLGPHSALATVLTRLMRAERLEIEVAHVHRPWQVRQARNGAASRVPLIRDDTGTVIARAAGWLPQDGEPTIRGEAVVDDTVLFDGAATGVRIEPIAAMPGLRAAVLTGRLRPARWVTGRAAQLGTTGAVVVRDGEPAPRPVRRSTFYRHTQGWLRVGGR